jgi:hypothetical protein
LAFLIVGKNVENTSSNCLAKDDLAFFGNMGKIYPQRVKIRVCLDLASMFLPCMYLGGRVKEK